MRHGAATPAVCVNVLRRMWNGWLCPALTHIESMCSDLNHRRTLWVTWNWRLSYLKYTPVIRPTTVKVCIRFMIIVVYQPTHSWRRYSTDRRTRHVWPSPLYSKWLSSSQCNNHFQGIPAHNNKNQTTLNCNENFYFNFMTFVCLLFRNFRSIHKGLCGCVNIDGNFVATRRLRFSISLRCCNSVARGGHTDGLFGPTHPLAPSEASYISLFSFFYYAFCT